MDLPHESISYITAFLGGVVVSFSPCVYPLVSITLSFIGVRAGASRLKGFRLSLVYVLGVAITYSTLGIAAAMTGSLFGQLAAHPASSILIGIACILAGLSFLDVLNVASVGFRLQHKVMVKGGYLPVLLFGLVSGLIAGPCTAPALGTILLLVAKKQNVLYGASLLFVFAYGMGLLLILTGTFGSFMLHFVKSEAWLLRIKKLSGFVLIGIGGYFLIQAGRLM